jgi:hypothetical protein
MVVLTNISAALHIKTTQESWRCPILVIHRQKVALNVAQGRVTNGHSIRRGVILHARAVQASCDATRPSVL